MRANAAVGNLERPSGAHSHACACVLIVDDDPATLKLAAGALETRGYLVEQASDAAQVRAILERSTPNLILADITLPGRDGLALTLELKADARLKHVPIIALTGPALEGEDAKAREAACDGCIAKPVEARRMPVQIAAYLVRGPVRGAGDPHEHE
jgi:CheY-like chemotaxis protein